MRTIDKQFAVTSLPLSKMQHAIGTFNAKKFGRNRRGVVQLRSCTATRQDDGAWLVRLSYLVGVRRCLKVVNGPKYPVYGLFDFSTLEKALNAKGERVAV